MNYEQTRMKEQLAGAYVVGTLRGSARSRFERLCVASQGLRAAVRHWEDQLMPLLPDLVPVTPSARVWEYISQRTSSRVAGRRGSWRWALVAGLALSVLAIVSIRLIYPPFQVAAAVGQDKVHPLWEVSRSKDSTSLVVRALQPVSSNPRLAYELWALPRGGKPPVSLGLLPRTGRIERDLNASQRTALLNSNQLAVSLEPAGGSPSGAPTGPVVFVAELRQTS